MLRLFLNSLEAAGPRGPHPFLCLCPPPLPFDPAANKCGGGVSNAHRKGRVLRFSYSYWRLVPGPILQNLGPRGQGRWNKKETKEPPNFLLCPEGILCIGQLLSSSWLAVGRLHRKNRAARGRGIGYVFRVFNLMRSCDRGEKNTNDPLPLLP